MNDAEAQILQIHSLENGKGLQYLLNEAYKILGNPFFLHNMEYEFVACTENVETDDQLWSEVLTAGVFSEDTIKFFFEECFIDTVAGTDAIAVLVSDKLKYKRIYGRIFNCYKNTVGDLIMLACNRPLEEQDTAMFEAVCDKLSQEIKSDEFYKNYGILYHEKLICQLLDYKIGDKMIYSDHLANLYEGLRGNLFVIAADIAKYRANENSPGELRNLFKEMQPEFKYAVYSHYIVIIASTDELLLNAERDYYKLNEYFAGNCIRTGISGGFDNLLELRKHFEAAAAALKEKSEIKDN